MWSQVADSHAFPSLGGAAKGQLYPSTNAGSSSLIPIARRQPVDSYADSKGPSYGGALPAAARRPHYGNSFAAPTQPSFMSPLVVHSTGVTSSHSPSPLPSFGHASALSSLPDVVPGKKHSQQSGGSNTDKYGYPALPGGPSVLSALGPLPTMPTMPSGSKHASYQSPYGQRAIGGKPKNK